MSSQALARKYRPQTFEGVVGQETTVQILKNALTQKRFHHAYLFTGPRGIGKTSLARIFAKALNCEKGPAAEPCNGCTACIEITEGRSLSVQEIDGASNTSVEDVRDLREKIRYLPPGGRFKIYIIDEVHMLSTAAFNALLKTLEEPPPHAMFLFATTDAQKMPATVLSRVIRFDLRPISRTAMAAQLKKIALEEAVPVEDKALFQIAREAEGGLRDALSLMDQILSFGDGKVTLATVEEVVGVSTKRFVQQIAESVLKHDAAQVLKISEDASQSGVDTKRLALDLLEYFRHLLVAQVTQENSLFDLTEEDIRDLAQQAQSTSPQNLDRLFRILQRGIQDLLRAPLPKIILEVLLLRLASFPGLEPLEELLEKVKGGVSGSSTPNPRPTVSSSPSPPPPARSVSSLENSQKSWPEFLNFLKGQSMRLLALVEQGECLKRTSEEIVLKFPKKSSMTVELLKDPERESALQRIASEFFKRSIKIHYQLEQEMSTSPRETSNLLQEAITIFEPKSVTTAKSGSL